MKKIATVDKYFKSIPKDMRTALEKLRKTINPIHTKTSYSSSIGEKDCKG